MHAARHSPCSLYIPILELGAQNDLWLMLRLESSLLATWFTFTHLITAAATAFRRHLMVHFKQPSVVSEQDKQCLFQALSLSWYKGTGCRARNHNFPALWLRTQLIYFFCQIAGGMFVVCAWTRAIFLSLCLLLVYDYPDVYFVDQISVYIPVLLLTRSKVRTPKFGLESPYARSGVSCANRRGNQSPPPSG